MQSLSCENEFYLHQNNKINHSHINGFAFSLALKKKTEAWTTMKWPPLLI